MMPKKSFHVEGLDSDLYDGDVVDLNEYNGHFILRYGWTILEKLPYKGWYFKCLTDPKLIVQAASVNLSLVVVHPRNDRPDEFREQFHRLHS